MATIRSYKELNVYQTAMSHAVRIYELSRGFPAEEKYSLTDQIRRSSRSVCANLAEAWRKRRYPKAFVSKLSDNEIKPMGRAMWFAPSLLAPSPFRRKR